ncbi:MAG: PD-(D/E)XK nuclease family protein [Myxococcota bacterium]
MTQPSLDFGATSQGDAGDPPAPPHGERVLIAPGPRAAEALLLRELAREVEAARANPRLLATPVRVIVPSRSLREHVAAQLVRAHGGLAGVVVQTLRGLCHELLRTDAEPLRSGDALAPILVRRAAARSPVLREALSLLDDGYGVVEATVRDLLDAGLTEANADAAREALASLRAGPDVARAQAVVDVALVAMRELAALGFAPRAALFARAAERVRDGGVCARAIWVHGYADVTGVQLDVLEALLRDAGARIVLDHPPDPTALGDELLGVAFTERLRLRLGAGSALACAPAPPAKLALLRAAGASSEVRAVAERVREALAAGTAPEAIAIVARDLAPYRFALSTHLRRLAIPYSGGTGFLDAAGRRLQSLLTWLEQGERTPADRWLEAHGALRDADDLRVAFHGIGAGRLGDVAQLDVAALLEDAHEYVLPVRRAHVSASEGEVGSGLEGEEGDAEEAERAARGAKLTAKRRRVKRTLLERAVQAAQRALAVHAALGADQPLGSALAQLLEFTSSELHWRHDTPGRSELAAAQHALAESAPSGFVLTGEELRVLLRRALRDLGVTPLGGSGGGVRVLSVTEARARSFAHVFLVGANRDVFPRSFSEDALLPDALRRALEAALPDIPIKRRAVDEDRYLFAQLASSAPSVHISWQAVSDDGKERPASPLVSRLELPGAAVASAGPVWEAHASGPLPAQEHALRAALAGAPEAAAQAAELALGAGGAAAARARRAALAELDAPPSSVRLGPFFGFVGDRTDARDLSVSRLEGAVRCGWQVFLEHVLGLEPPVDALAALPEITGLLLGNTVHGALEEMAERAGLPSGISLDAARASEPRALAWPAPAEADELLLVAARRVARDEGVVLPGFAQLLAHRAREVFARVGEVDWPSGVRSSVLAVEVNGTRAVEGAGEPIRIGFRADRVDRAGASLDLTDYKTGKPFTSDGNPAKREEKLRKRVAAGVLLQGAAYSLSVGGEGRGRYLYARPDAEPDRAEVATRADPQLAEAFDEAVTTIVRAWRAGAFVPRLAKYASTEEGDACNNCRVAESCLRGDTAARLRLARWRDAGARADDTLQITAARGLLALGKPER